MKIGLICSKPPFPIIDGGNFASKVLVDSLKQNHEVHAVIIETDKHPFSDASLNFCNSSFRSFSSVYLNTKITFLGMLRSFLKGESYKGQSIIRKSRKVTDNTVFIIEFGGKALVCKVLQGVNLHKQTKIEIGPKAGGEDVFDKSTKALIQIN